MIAHTQDDMYVYMIYEYLDSGDLRTLIKAGKLEMQEAA